LMDTLPSAGNRSTARTLEIAYCDRDCTAQLVQNFMDKFHIALAQGWTMTSRTKAGIEVSLQEELGPMNYPLRCTFEREVSSKAERRKRQEDERRAKLEARTRKRSCKQKYSDEEMIQKLATGFASFDIEIADVETSSDEELELDLLSSVRHWMRDQERTTHLRLEDLHLVLRHRGHTHSSSSDQLAAMLHAVAEDTCQRVDLCLAKLQPNVVAESSAAIMEQWKPVLGHLWESVGDEVSAGQLLAQAARDGVSAAFGAGPRLLSASSAASVSFWHRLSRLALDAYAVQKLASQGTKTFVKLVSSWPFATA